MVSQGGVTPVHVPDPCQTGRPNAAKNGQPRIIGHRERKRPPTGSSQVRGRLSAEAVGFEPTVTLPPRQFSRLLGFLGRHLPWPAREQQLTWPGTPAWPQVGRTSKSAQAVVSLRQRAPCCSSPPSRACC